MQKLIPSLFLIFYSLFSYSQNVGIGTQTPHPSAALEIADSSRGILIPRMTTSQRIAIQNPGDGLMVYQIDGIKGYWFWDGIEWRIISSLLTNGSSLVGSKYFFKLGGWGTNNTSFWPYGNFAIYNNYIKQFASDSNVIHNNSTGEILFLTSGVYKINIQAILPNGSQIQRCDLNYFSITNNSWTYFNNRIITWVATDQYQAQTGFLYTDLLYLDIKPGDKLQIRLAPRSDAQNYNISISTGGIEIEKVK